MDYLLAYLAAISVISASITVFDKVCAIKHRRRVRESSLLLLSAIGGSAAMLITMLAFRHKTRHIKFMLGIPLIILFQLIAFYAVWRWFLGAPS